MASRSFVSLLRLGIIAATAAVAVGIILLLGSLTSRAVQNPTLAIDMVTADNTYDETTNTMSVGFNPATDFCLATATTIAATHLHTAHVLVQNVEDLVGWQVRLEYTGDRFRPNSVNFTPFTDNVTGQNISFVNLPIVVTVHRDIVSSSNIPPSAAGPQIANFGSVHIGAPNFPVSPDTPAKITPDDSSYSAPGGGVLASFTLQVVGDQSGQHLSIDMAAKSQPPMVEEGSGVSVFDGTGLAVMDLPETSLGDASHAEGAACQAATPTPPPPTPTPPPSTPTPTPGPGGGGPCKCFNPQVSAFYSDTTPGSHPDVSSTSSLGLGADGQPYTSDDTGDYDFAGGVGLSLSSPADADIPDAALLGTVNSTATLGVVNNSCTRRLDLAFILMEGTTDINNTVHMRPFGSGNELAEMAGDDPPFEGQQVVKPPPAVTSYPSFLNAIFDHDWVDYGPDRIAGNADDNNGPLPPIKPRFRAVGVTYWSARGVWVIVQNLVFEPGTKLPNLPAFDPVHGFPSVSVLQTSSAAGSATPPIAGPITDACTPVINDSVSYGISGDNPDTTADEGGLALRTLPAEAGASVTSALYAFSQRDADQDGYENTLDTCPLDFDSVWNPRDSTLPIEGDRDLFAGLSAPDGIPDTCDPTPDEATAGSPSNQPIDHDGDGYPNRGDNCPLVPNGSNEETTPAGNQKDSDVNQAGEIVGDGIGDACDPNPDTPDGVEIVCVRTLTVVVGGDPNAAVRDCQGSLPGAGGGSFNPQSTLTFASTAPGDNSDITLSFDLEAPDLLFSEVVNFSPTDVGIPPGPAIPDGARVGTLNSRATLGLFNNSCTNSNVLDFTLFDATTDTGNTINASFAFLAGDINNDGVADIRPPPIVTQYPSFLNTLFGGVTPRARYAAATWISSAGFWAVLQFVVFEPGTVLPGFAFDPALGYPTATVLLDPTLPPGPTTISDFCSPLTTSATIFGITQDNPDTQPNEGGIALRTNPAATGPIDFTLFAASRRDADGDGIDNNLDPCPLHTDTVWDPRDGTPPVEGDSDLFAGAFAPDGIPDTCDTTPTEPTSPLGGQPTDHDGDGFINRLDNCPLVFNPDQADTDLNIGGVPTPDGIGNACDTPGTDAGMDFAGRPVLPRSVAGQGAIVPDGPRLICTRTITLVIGGPNDGVAGPCRSVLPGEEIPCLPPSNDDIGSATVTSGVPFSDQVSTTCATSVPDDPDCFGRGHSAWYSFTPSQSLRVEANTFGSSYDTTLSAYSGSPGGLTPIACNDQAAGTNQSRVRFDAVAGQTYWFMVASFFGGPGGNLVFSLDFGPPRLAIDVSIAPVGSVVARDGAANVHGTVSCSKPAFVFLDGGLSQKAGRATISGAFSASLLCEGETFWQADVRGDNGRFVGGKAEVSLEFFAFAVQEEEFVSGQSSGAVVLRGSRPPQVAPCTGRGNDGFEAGAVDTNAIPCWTVVNQEGGSGSWCNQAGTAPPQGACAGSTQAVAAPVEGSQAAMTNQQGPGSHALYRCGVLLSGTISFQLQINNRADDFFSPPSLNFTGPPNQQFRADLLAATAVASNPFTVAPQDVLLNLYQTKPGDPAVSAYATVTADASAYVGQNVCLRFAGAENQFFLNAGVDDVRVDLRRRNR